MAYVGDDLYVAAWAAGPLTKDKLSQTAILLLEESADQGEQEGIETEPTRGFIIQDWFGPFLLGPASRFVRGRC
jgi:hypothetical protein|uniref:Uncharacterized protein n=1 Tax=Desulfobacca acetoxidans TaxID=60893 RepID=A0A7V6A5Z6_9BACT